jgi:hypothetical protein
MDKLLPDWIEKESTQYKGKTFYKHIKTGDSQWTKPTLPDSLVEHFSISKQRPYYKNKYTGVTQWEPYIIPRGLYWVGQSCYLDSSLFALFAGLEDTEFIKQLLTMNLDVHKDDLAFFKNLCAEDEDEDLEIRKDIQKELLKISNSITRKGDRVLDCCELRNTLARCPTTEKYYKEKQAESGGFIYYLLNMFPTSKMSKTETIYGTHNITDSFRRLKRNKELEITTSTRDILNSVPIHLVGQDILLKDEYISGEEKVLLSATLSSISDSGMLTPTSLYTDKKYRRKISVEEIVYTPCLIFNIARQLGERDDDIIFLETEIEKEDVIMINDSRFSLCAVVMFRDRHYVSIAKMDYYWYYYNDLSNQITQYNTFEDIVSESKINPSILNPLTHGVQFYYKPRKIV